MVLANHHGITFLLKGSNNETVRFDQLKNSFYENMNTANQEWEKCEFKLSVELRG